MFKRLLLPAILLLCIAYGSSYVTWSDVKSTVTTECNKYSIPAINHYLVRSVIFYESGIYQNNKEMYNTRAISSTGCLGVMQISRIGLKEYNNKMRLKNAKHVAITANDLYDYTKNIRVGIFLLVLYYQQKKKDLYLTLYQYSGKSKNYITKVVIRSFEYTVFTKE